MASFQRKCFGRLASCMVVAFANVLIGQFLCENVIAQSPQPLMIQSEITTVQPMTGIVLWNDHEKVDTDSVQLEFRYCGYDEIVQPDGSYDFSKIDSILDQIASRKHQAVLRFRFVYPGKRTTVPEFLRRLPDYDETTGESEGETTRFCDWSNSELQEFTLDFYSRFAQRYDRDPRLAFLQTGFGLWAEYHIYDGPRKMGKTFPDKPFQTRFLKHLDQVFDKLPWMISVDAADFDYSPLEDNDKLLALKFGVFDDSFLCKTHAEENAENWKILDTQRFKHSPGGGEFSYYNRRDQSLALSEEGPNGVSFHDAARQFHITFMIGNDQPDHQSFDRISEAGMYTGYRFKVLAANCTGDTVRLEVVNDGVAPIYRDAYFAAGGKRATQTLRGLQPGQKISFEISGVPRDSAEEISIESDYLVPGQKIEFEANF